MTVSLALTSSQFNDQVQLAFREAIADGLSTSSITSDDVLITSSSRRSTLSVAYEVFTGFTDTSAASALSGSLSLLVDSTASTGFTSRFNTKAAAVDSTWSDIAVPTITSSAAIVASSSSTAENGGSAGGDSSMTIVIIVVVVVALCAIACIAYFVHMRQSGNAQEASAEPHKDTGSVHIEMGVQPTSAETRFNDPAMSQINDQVLNAPGAWDWFITHMQTEASTLAEGIYHEFRNRGLRVWLDVKMHERDEAAIREGIMNSAKVLVIITVSYFTRPHCIKELRWARDAGKDIVVCIDVKDKQRIGEILCTAPEDLKSLGNINFIDMNRGDTDYFQVGIKKLLEANPKKLDYELRPAHS